MNTGSRSRPPVLLLFGPTASGKSKLLEKLFGPGTRGEELSRLPQAEIISADSMQVYRGMDIGTAKPSLAERRLLPHHLIDLRDPDQQFSSGEFTALAEACIDDIASRGKLPVVSGGTAFYLKNLLFGHPPAPPSDPRLREELRAELEAKGAEALMAELRAADPDQAEKIHIHDEYRLTRALEVFRASGRALSSFRPPEGPRTDYHFLCIGIDRPRDILYARINARVDEMMAAGLPEEARGLAARGYRKEDPGMQAIGYREFLEADPGTGDAAIAEGIKRDTRRYAKRQLTFFRSLPGVEWFGAEDFASISSRIASWLSA